MKPQLREDGRLILTIRTEKELRTYMQPLRQKILFELGLCPAGMTAKQLADTLHIAPSSAGHHLGKLEELGLVELARTESIHGITAKFYRATDVTVSIDVVKGSVQMHQALVQNSVAEQAGRLTDLMALVESGAIPRDAGSSNLSTGMIYLTPAEAEAWHTEFDTFIHAHTQPREGTQAYEYSLLMLNLTLWQQHRAEFKTQEAPAPEG